MAPPVRPSIISPDELERVGRLLYGEMWQAAMARSLKMGRRSIVYMMTGERGIHEGIVRDILALVDEQREEMCDVARMLRKRLPKE